MGHEHIRLRGRRLVYNGADRDGQNGNPSYGNPSYNAQPDRSYLFSREDHVRRTLLCALTSVLLSGAFTAAHAQPAPTLTAAEKSGRAIFQTRCAMCHVGQEPAAELQSPNPERRPATMGPLLSKTNASNEATLRGKIKDGSVRMPGYKYTLSDDQVDQVIAFMKTIDKPLTRIYVTRAGE